MPVEFRARLPRPLQVEDTVTVRGTIQNNASRISFNFLVDESPLYVALHFKTLFGPDVPPYKAVILNSKNGYWSPEEEYENTWQMNGSNEFFFKFVFLEDGIYIYSRDFLYEYKHRLNYDKITNFEIWDDLDTVTELSFMFSNSGY